MRAPRCVGVALLVPVLLIATVAGSDTVRPPHAAVTPEPAATVVDGAARATALTAAAAPSTSAYPVASRERTTGRLPRADKGGTVVPAPAEPTPIEPTLLQPAPTAPVTVEPVPTQPVLTEPVVAEPVAAEPVAAEPVVAEPVAIQPVPAEPAPTGSAPTAAPSPVPAPVPDVECDIDRPVPLGVTVPWGPLDRDRLAATTATVGTAPAYLQWYTGFGEAVDVPKLKAVVDAGAVPVVTWEPWVWTDGVDQPRFAMSTVAAGRHDAYLTQWADALAAWDGPVMLRFAHEMNGSWYPWAAGVNGNTAADHVAAWRHVHDLFAARGADRVQWVWAPNVTYPGSTPLSTLYPGDAYVDVVGVDGYNWGTSVPGRTWQSPAQVLGPTVAELRSIAPTKPLLVTETASTELGGDKAAWVTELFAWAADQHLLGVIWFDENKETDWRVASSERSAAAFRQATAP